MIMNIIKSSLFVLGVTLGTAICKADIPEWYCNPSDYQYKMVIYPTLALEGSEITSSDAGRYIIYAFCGEECRGYSDLIYISQLDCYCLRIQLRSNRAEGEQLTFRLYDWYQDCIIDLATTVTFSDGDQLGKTSNPYTLLDVPLGDADRNLIVDNNDISATANYLLEKTPATFDPYAADVDRNHRVSVADLVGIIKLK